MLMTAEDVLADLDGTDVDVVRAERVAREVPGEDGTGHGVRRAGPGGTPGRPNAARQPGRG